MQSQTQTISIPVLFNISQGKNTRTNTSPKSPNSKITTTTTTTTYQSPPVKTYYRKFNNNNNYQSSVFMTVSSSSKKTTTTTTTRNNNKVPSNSRNGVYIEGSGRHMSSSSFEIPFLFTLFSFSFKYIFIISYNVIDKLLFIVLNPWETLICVSYHIAELKAMKRHIDELTFDREQLMHQGEQLLNQLIAARNCARSTENSYRAMKQKRDILKDTVNALQNELSHERESRFVVEKCHIERIEKLEFEVDMKDQEIQKYEDQERVLKRRIHKLQKKLKKAKAASKPSLSLPTYSLQNFDPFSFDDNENADDKEVGEIHYSQLEEESDDDTTSSSSESEDEENFVFARDSDDGESGTDSASDFTSDSETDSDSDLEDMYTPREIPKDSIYYGLSHRSNDKTREEEEEEEEEEELNSKKGEQNPFMILRQDAYNCLYQSLVSELCSSSILMDLDVKMDQKNFTSSTCLNIILEALVRFLEAKGQLTNEEAIEALFMRYRSLILNYTDTEEDQMNLLISLEYICIENSLRLQQHLRLLMAVYKAELVDPQVIIQWYHLLPDVEDNGHRSCPMTPSLNCVLPKLLGPTEANGLPNPHHNSNGHKRKPSTTDPETGNPGQMIDGHYATASATDTTSSLSKDIVTGKGESNNSLNGLIRREAKAFTNKILGAGAKSNEEVEEIKALIPSKTTTKSSHSHGGRSGHARTASGSLAMGAGRRRRSISNASDAGCLEVYSNRLRKDVRELAKVFALWLESKESSSSDDESLLDSMSMSQDLEEESEDSEESVNELQRLHRKLLSDEDESIESSSNAWNESEKSSDVVSWEAEGLEANATTVSLPSKKCIKKVTFNLSVMEDHDEDATIHNEEEDLGVNPDPSPLKKGCPLLACLEKNPLAFCQNFEFSEEEEEEATEEVEEENEEESESEEEEIIEEVEEIIEEEEEVIEEEIIEEEEEILCNDEDTEEIDENITIVEEKEEIIDEVVECIKVTC